MLSKNRIKLITSLRQKKYRNSHQLFTVEGYKTIKEFLNSDFELEHLYAVEDSFENVTKDKYTIISEADLKKISSFKTTNSALAVFKFKEIQDIEESKLIVALDNVRDPGNLGTIIRLCDWFGVTDLLCNKETVDCYNSKVIQATMGSLTRVNVIYIDLEAYLSEYDNGEVYGTFMDGENIYTDAVIEAKSGIIILGNEANGISENIAQYVTKKVAIPRFGNIKETESLNVAMAASIALSEFKRRTIEK